MKSIEQTESMLVEPSYREAVISDLDTLLQIENMCFERDRLSKRQLKYWLKASHRIMHVACVNDIPVAYALVILRKGTSLARLYSLAVLPSSRGNGIAIALLLLMEKACIENKRAYLRLEVSENNTPAIKLYQSLGYQNFGYYKHYYEDASNAVRMQKPILQKVQSLQLGAYPYFQQSTDFSCGPAALLMAMAKLNANTVLTQSSELDIWRTATTIFMTSGHGGTHPLGLALAAVERGFLVDVYINQPVPLFQQSVRSESKKAIIRQVEQDFVIKAEKAGVRSYLQNYDVATIKQALLQGAAVICLISSYQFDGYKGPHWVAVTHIDANYMYIHDPDESPLEDALGSGEVGQTYQQHIPVSLHNFDNYTQFGRARLRTALVLYKQENAGKAI